MSQPKKLYHLENDQIRITINSIGAELNSVFSKKLDRELLWQPTSFEGHSQLWPRQAPVLFPIVGKLKDNCYQHHNQTFSLSQHGFARDKEFTIKSVSADRISLLLLSDEITMSVFPFPFSLEIIYSLENARLNVDYQVRNTADDTLFFSIGGHPGFICPLFDEEKLEDYALVFECEEQPIKHLLQDGLRAGIEHQQRFRTLKLSESLFENDAIIFESLTSSYVDLTNTSDCYRLRFHFEGMPYLAFWKKPGMPFICIEPWCGIADSIQSDGRISNKEGINSLDKGQEFHCAYAISIE